MSGPGAGREAAVMRSARGAEMIASFVREAFISAPLALRLARLRRATGSGNVSGVKHPVRLRDCDPS